MRYLRIPLAVMGILIGSRFAQAQSSVDQVLASIATHNPEILARQQHAASQRLSYRTGLNPADPVVGLDYMVGSPVGAGNQTDLTLTQVLDFPTAYARKHDLADAQTASVDLMMAEVRREVLLEAKLVCIEMVYHRRQQTQLELRQQSMNALVTRFQEKLSKGEGIILDVNKARMQLVAQRAASQQNMAALAQLQTRLNALNGGQALAFEDTVYPALPLIPTLEQLLVEASGADPVRMALEQDVQVARATVSVARAMRLPKLEVGYHYQSILGQYYNGVHTGLSLPLWEHRGTVEAQQAQEQLAGLELQAHQVDRSAALRRLHAEYTSLRQTWEEYVNLLGGASNVPLLDKALALGQLTSIEYFMERAYYDDAIDRLLVAERDWQIAGARLMAHLL